jgi:hypothetical protein
LSCNKKDNNDAAIKTTLSPPKPLTKADSIVNEAIEATVENCMIMPIILNLEAKNIVLE